MWNKQSHKYINTRLQELQGLIDEANQSLEESGTPSHEIMVIVLHREFTAGSIGITLAGGADYESKDITVREFKYCNVVILIFLHCVFIYPCIVYFAHN